MGHKRVVHVIDDEADVCEALKVLLHTAGLEARTYASAEEFLSEVRLSRPLCLLVDVRLPGMSGLDLVRQLQQAPVRPVVVMITGHGDVPLAVKAMRAGALHFLEKPFEPAELLQTLEEAHQRVSEMAAEEATAAAIEASYRSLTPREQEVMALLAEGMPTKLLATKLGISTRTAEHHRAAVLQEDGRADGVAPRAHEHEPQVAEYAYTVIGNHHNSGPETAAVLSDRGAASWPTSQAMSPPQWNPGASNLVRGRGSMRSEYRCSQDMAGVISDAFGDAIQARWISKHLSTAPVDRAAAQEGVGMAFREAGLAQPRIVWRDGPVSMAASWAAASSGVGPNDRISSLPIPTARRCRGSKPFGIAAFG